MRKSIYEDIIINKNYMVGNVFDISANKHL